MATRRTDTIKAAVVKEMAGRDLSAKEAYIGGPSDPQEVNKGGTLYPTKVRLSRSDLRILQAIAEQEGTTPSALIRKAIKELIRRQGAGLR